MNKPHDLPGYLQPWVGVIPPEQLQAGAQAAREHQQQQEAHTARRDDHQAPGQQDRSQGQPYTRGGANQWTD